MGTGGEGKTMGLAPYGKKLKNKKFKYVNRGIKTDFSDFVTRHPHSDVLKLMAETMQAADKIQLKTSEPKHEHCKGIVGDNPIEYNGWDKSLSKFWAQEYIGADLSSKELRMICVVETGPAAKKTFPAEKLIFFKSLISIHSNSNWSFFLILLSLKFEK